METYLIVGCRNLERAEAAKADLEEKTGKKGIFEVLIIDVMDFTSVRNAVSNLSDPIDGIILNAGGPGGRDISGITKDGVTNIMAVNTMGHALLVEECIQSKKLSKGSSVIYVSSEGARGVPNLGFPQPKIESGSVDEFKEAIDGSKFVKLKDQSYETTYSFAKLTGNLWSNCMSRKFPEYRFVSVSPGMTDSTQIANDFPPFKKFIFTVLSPVVKILGMSHGPDLGAKRYLDTMFDFESYKTGKFYGSVKGLIGPLGDQEQFFDALSSETFQDNAYEAIKSFF